MRHSVARTRELTQMAPPGSPVRPGGRAMIRRMSVSLAIHRRPGSFSDRWIERARALGIPHRIVDCLGPGIVEELAPHDALMWHWTHTDKAELLAARAIIRAAEELGLLVFPSTETCWSFDDKIAQLYQLRALGAPVARTWCFYSEPAALAFLESADFPMVMKLRRGAGSTNVRLVRDRAEARHLARRAFGHGFSTGSTGGGILPSDPTLRLARARRRGNLAAVALRAPRTLLDHWRTRRDLGRERGYLYLQEFLPGNAYDLRVTVIGARAFAFSRNVREHDFRASGSGSIDYSRSRVKPECLRIAFDLAARLRAQSAAFDFAFDAAGAPRVLEVSFGFLAKYVHECPGYFDDGLRFVEGHTWPQDAIFDDLLAALERSAGVPRARGGRQVAAGCAATGPATGSP